MEFGEFFAPEMWQKSDFEAQKENLSRTIASNIHVGSVKDRTKSKYIRGLMAKAGLRANKYRSYPCFHVNHGMESMYWNNQGFQCFMCNKVYPIDDLYALLNDLGIEKGG